MLRKKTEFYKRKKQISKCSPVSKSLVEALNGPSWSYYSGTLDGASVVVTCSGDMSFLFRMGFFGKGSLSRSNPDFSEQKQKVFVRQPSSSEAENDFKSQKFIMSKRNYLLHSYYKDLSKKNSHDSDHCRAHQNDSNERSPRKRDKTKLISQVKKLNSQSYVASVCTEFYPHLTSVLHSISSSTNEQIASYVCVSRSMLELSSDILCKHHLNQSMKEKGSNRDIKIHSNENDSVLILDSDEEQIREIVTGNKSADLYDERTDPFWTCGSRNETTISLANTTLTISAQHKLMQVDEIQSPSDSKENINQFVEQSKCDKSKCPTSPEDQVIRPTSQKEYPIAANLLSKEDQAKRPASPKDQVTKPISREDQQTRPSYPQANVTRQTLSTKNEVNKKTQTLSAAHNIDVLRLLTVLPKSPQGSFVIKPATYLYKVGSKTHFTSALLRFYSLDPVVHFDYTCEPDHLPAAIFIAENKVSYLRIFPPIADSLAVHKVKILNQRYTSLPGLEVILHSHDHMADQCIQAPLQSKCASEFEKNTPSDSNVSVHNTPTDNSVPVQSTLTDNSVPVQSTPTDNSVPVQSTPTDNSVPVQSTPTDNSVPVQSTPTDNSVPVQSTPTDNSVPVQSTPTDNSVPVQSTPTDNSVPVQSTLTDNSVPVQSTPTDNSVPVQSTPTDNSVPVQSTPTDNSVPVQSTPTDNSVPVQSTSTDNSVPVQSTSTDNSVPAQSTPTDNSVPVQSTPTDKSVPVQSTPTDNSVPVQSTSTDNSVPAQSTPTDNSVPVQSTPTDKSVPVQSTPTDNSVSDAEETVNTHVSFLVSSDVIVNNQKRHIIDNVLLTSKKLKLCSPSHTDSCQTNVGHCTDLKIETVTSSSADDVQTNMSQEMTKDVLYYISNNCDKNSSNDISEQICIDSSSCTSSEDEEDDESADCLVIANTSDDEDHFHWWRPCLKKDPCPVKENLLLTLEEAFFLSYGLGCLCVTDCNQKKLSLTEMWHKFQELKDQFIPHYVVYHYFRSKGWVPKSGLKFGCDFILYRDGPPFYHGSYSVLIMTVKDRNILPHLKNDGYYFDQHLRNWADLSGVNRVVDQVAKTLMLCYVIWPEDELNDEDLLSPKCLVKFKVKEVIVSRWVSSQEREYLAGEDIP